MYFLSWVALVQVQRCSLELTLHSLLHAAVGLSEHGPKEFLSDSNIMVVYLEHMVSTHLVCVCVAPSVVVGILLLGFDSAPIVWHLSCACL